MCKRARYDSCMSEPRSRFRRRIVVRAIVFLVLGTVVNVAVAWAFAAAESLPATNIGASGYVGHQERWSYSILEGWGIEYIDLYRQYDSATHLMVDADVVNGLPYWVSTHPPTSREDEIDMLWAVAAGWPVRCVWGEYRFDGTAHLRMRGGVALAGTLHHAGVGVPRALPTKPIWSGIAINTIFYTAILWGGWLVFPAVFLYRRRWRIKHGLCLACAYPIGTSEVCTECGKPVKARSVETA